MTRRPLRIAFIGTRGIPASYSGFETCAEQLGVRLADRGHDVTVYCRSHFRRVQEDMYRGVRLVTLPTVQTKYGDTIVHTLLSSVHALRQRYDVALYFIAGNSPLAWIPRLAGQRTLINVDGLDWRRRKWPPVAKAYLRAAERLAAHTANAVVTDSRVVAQYYRDVYGYQPHYIPYGSEVTRRPPGPVLERYGLAPRRYVLFVGRLVPENCAHHLVQAFDGLQSDMRCVIVGDAPYVDAYRQALRNTTDPRVLFTGYAFGESYEELSSNSYAFVETSEVGGTHPALLEAMGFGTAVVANGTAENRETIGDAGLLYDTKAGAHALRDVLHRLIEAPVLRDQLAAAAATRAASIYSWDRITDEYEALFLAALGRTPAERATTAAVGPQAS